MPSRVSATASQAISHQALNRDPAPTPQAPVIGPRRQGRQEDVARGVTEPLPDHRTLTTIGARRPARPSQDRAPTAAAPLQSPRLRDSVLLQRIAAGQAVLCRGARGNAVKRVQRLLIDLGYFLPSGADGRFGPETERAVRAVQADRDLHVDGKLGPQSLAQLDRLAPSNGAQAELFPEYERLFEDGRLDVTMAVGFDESGWHARTQAELEAGLRQRGFSLVDVEQASASELARLGVRDPDPTLRTYHRRYAVAGREIDAVVKLITPDSQAPKEKFATALERGEVVFYGGHARYGTGPDFDHIDSPAQNYVIGTGGSVHRRGLARRGSNPTMNKRLRNESNDLEAAQLDPDLYQLWFLNGCTTSNYLDEIRAADNSKDGSSLDIVGSTRPLMWGDTADNGLLLLDSLLAQRSEHALRRALDRSNGGAGTFFGDGFAGNRYRPR